MGVQQGFLLALSFFFLLNFGCSSREDGGGDLKNGRNSGVYAPDEFDYGDSDDWDGGGSAGGGAGTVNYGPLVSDGEGANGKVSQDALKDLVAMMGALSAGGQNQAKNLIIQALDNCAFLQKPNPNAEKQCKAGSPSGCAQQVMNFGSNFFNTGLQSMNYQGQNIGQIIYTLKDDCKAIDVSNPVKALSEMEKLRKKCTKGDFASCLMLLFYSIKLMISSILKSVLGGLGAGI